MGTFRRVSEIGAPYVKDCSLEKAPMAVPALRVGADSRGARTEDATPSETSLRISVARGMLA